MLSNRDRFFPRQYRKAKHKVSFLKKNQTREIRITHNGFERLKIGIKKHMRHFIFHDDYVVIKDTLHGQGKFYLETFFHQKICEISKIKAGCYKIIPNKLKLNSYIKSSSKTNLKRNI